MNEFSKSIDEADPIRSVFTPLIGLPAWNVQKGYGSFLTFDFGVPHLSIREPVDNPRTEHPNVRKRLQRRSVRPHGEFYLWIYCCHWRCAENGVECAHDESADAEIHAAASFMDGQILRAVQVDPASGGSLFRFDLGATLETWPYANDDNDEQWSLEAQQKFYFSYRADGQYSWAPHDCLPDQMIWKSLLRSQP